KKLLAEGKSTEDILPEAYATVREAAKRTLGQRAFDTQIIGGIVLHQGKIAEMKTGEGKTLAATFPVYLNALLGKGVHLVTVNDYLARRDASWMGQIYDYLGLSVSCIQHEKALIYDSSHISSDHKDEGLVLDVENMKPCERKQAYLADITYGTNNEFGFDYLRDNMVVDVKDRAQRPLHYAIVDEVDSILIDEARTPLIISAPAQESTDKYRQFAEVAKKLAENEDYNIDEKDKTATLTDQGITGVEKLLNIKNIYEEGGVVLVHHLEEALKAETLFKKDKDYVVRDGEIVIVDQFTGRLMPGRRYSEGLHQAIEAKEGVSVKRESVTLATVSLQNYFRLYSKLSGMTGTAVTEAEEFYKIYELEVVEIPTNRPMVRKDMSDKVYKNEQAKFRAVVQEVKERKEKGQPVLVGTVSIEKNETLSSMFKKAGIKHEILNAKNNEKEARIIAQAGKSGTITLATNIAGRGVDIILGGHPYNKQSAQKVIDVGGLHILGTERHESRRIDNQLRGRSGRQGDAGSSQFYVSMTDDLMRVFGGDRMMSIMNTLKIPEDQPIENVLISRSIESAQKRVEGHNFDIRKHLVEYDDVLNKHRDTIYRKREKIITSEDLRKDILDLFKEEIRELINFHAQGPSREWNRKEIAENYHSFCGEKLDQDKLKTFNDKDILKNFLYDNIKSVYSEREQKLGRDNLAKVEKMVYLRSIDSLWIEHLTALDNLRTGIGLRGYAQKDPLVEYRAEAFRMFRQLLDAIREQVLHLILKVEVRTDKPNIKSGQTQNTDGHTQSNLNTARQEESINAGEQTSRMMQSETSSRKVFNNQNKVGRNDPCFCGSGKKFKKCHGK
ncbi:preprotein translocase subunit SecA, partial [Patescibacteria group bacterium]